MHKGGLYLYPACASNNVNNRAMGTCKLSKVIQYISKVDFAQSQVVMCHPTSYGVITLEEIQTKKIKYHTTPEINPHYHSHNHLD